MYNLIFQPSPTEFFQNLSSLLKIKLFIKRDDLVYSSFGSSKARKLAYILGEAKQKGFNAMVTTGSPFSNHIRESAFFSLQLKWPLINIIHVNNWNEKHSSLNLNLINFLGIDCRIVQKIYVSEYMDSALQELIVRGLNPLYVFGGGHCVEGAYALYQAVFELEEQLNGVAPDFIVVASGTGGTQAGLEVGVKKIFPKCKVLGVSVAREKVRGSNEVLKSIKELNEYLGNEIETIHEIYFDDNWIGESYAATYPELIDTIKWAAKTEGLLLDPIYTGKAFTALLNYVKNGVIPKGSNVVFWHTGGLINLFDSRII